MNRGFISQTGWVGLRLLAVLLLLTACLRAENLFKVMEKAEIFGINHAYDVDMSSNGNWIASSSQGTWRFLASTGTTSLISTSEVVLLSENSNLTDRNGVYWGMNVVPPAPPQPVGASLVGTTLSWTNGGGSTAGYLVSVGSTPSPPSASTGATLDVGTNPTFAINNFSDFRPGVLNYIALAATITAIISPAEWNMTRTFSDPGMTTKGFYRVKPPP